MLFKESQKSRRHLLECSSQFCSSLRDRRSLASRLLLPCAGEEGGVEVHHHLHGRLWDPGVEGEVQKGQTDVENPVFQVGDGCVAHGCVRVINWVFFSDEGFGIKPFSLVEPDQRPPPGLWQTHSKTRSEWHFYCSFPLVPFLEFGFLQQREWGNRSDTLKTDSAGLDVSGYASETHRAPRLVDKDTKSSAWEGSWRDGRKKLNCHKVTLIRKKNQKWWKQQGLCVESASSGITGEGKQCG